MANHKRESTVVCRRCRKPLLPAGQTDLIAYFEPCPRHPHNRRVDKRNQPQTIPHAIARHDRILVGVMLAELRKSRRPFAA